jgi:hypothetical protein
MIGIKILKPRTGLMPTSQRRITIALGLALAIALKRIGDFEIMEARAWRGAPDTAYVNGEKVDIELGRHVDIDIVNNLAREFRGKKWDGITATLNGELGKAKLGIDIDMYANEYVPERAGIINEGLEVLAEPRGYIGDEVIDSFYKLFDVEYEKMRAVIEELIAEMHYVELKVATYTGVRTYPLWRVTARVNAIHNYSFAPENAIPLWYKPWIRQITRDLYRLPPPGLGKLVGLHGMRRIIKDVALGLRKYLERYYIVTLRPNENVVQLIPRASSPSTQNHRNAIAGLKNILTEAMRETASKGAQRIIQEKGYIDWQDYIETLEEELRQRLA